jgi:hypothetical protein
MPHTWVNFDNSNLVAGHLISAQDVNDTLNNLLAELERKSKSASVTSSVTQGEKVTASLIENMKQYAGYLAVYKVNYAYQHIEANVKVNFPYSSELTLDSGGAQVSIASISGGESRCTISPAGYSTLQMSAGCYLIIPDSSPLLIVRVEDAINFIIQGAINVSNKVYQYTTSRILALSSLVKAAHLKEIRQVIQDSHDGANCYGNDCTSSCGLACTSACRDNCSGYCASTNCAHSCDTNCVNAGCQATCNGYCVGACARSSCASNCSSNCGASDCYADCQLTCYVACAKACLTTCKNDCLISCEHACVSDACVHNCTSACFTNCNNQCVGNCKGSCYLSCESGCSNSSRLGGIFTPFI